MSRSAEDWIQHVDGDDLVVTHVGFAPSTSIDYYLSHVPRRWFVTPDDFTTAREDREPLRWPYGPGEDIIIIGRFLGHDGLTENRPAVRFGNISMAPPLPVRHPWRIDQESFLVECRSVSGFSGSPVFVYRRGSTYNNMVAPIGAEESIGEPTLLGVDWGHLNYGSTCDYVIDWADETPDKAVRVSGMMVAVPAWRLGELLDSEVVQEVKREEEEQRHEGPPADLDFDRS